MTRKTTIAQHDVGQRLAAARLQRGLAQSDVARRAGIAPSYLSRLETGKIQPTFRTVLLVVETLGASLGEVFGPEPRAHKAHGPCPVTARGQCLLDLVRAEPDAEHYTPREIRLLRRFASWIKQAPQDRVRAIEILLEDLTHASACDADADT